MDPSTAERAAAILADAWKRHVQIEALPADARPRNEDEGYAIQFALDRALGFRTAGWKLGYSSPAGLKRIGFATPPAGRLYAHTVKSSPASFGRAELHAPKLESEFCFRLRRDLAPRGRDYTEDEAAAAVEGLWLAIEIADSRFRDPKAVGMLAGLADNTGPAD